MEQTAYEVALECRTPLALAISSVERSIHRREDLRLAGCERIVQYLYRAQHAFTKLAMSNSSVRRSTAHARSIDLAAEIRLIHRSLPEDMRCMVHSENLEQPVRIISATVFRSRLALKPY